ncbi:hypothetical protein D3C59_36795 [Streptomyces sp. SHP22-7]|nr:hypothetical protein D3C59_36795 [Streptomyces sp. SHP22-7]
MWPTALAEEFVAVAASIQMFLRTCGTVCRARWRWPAGAADAGDGHGDRLPTSDERYASLSSAAKTGPKSASA